MAALPSHSVLRTVAQRHGWFTSPRHSFRAMPIESMHANNPTTRFMSGSYEEDLSALPKTLFGWKEGQTLAWLVDLLSAKGETVYRIHFLDSAARAPFAVPPDLGDDKRVDVQILPVASWDKVLPYPDELLRVNRPRLVVLAHWEGFVGGSLDDPQEQRFAGDQDEFEARVRRGANGAMVVKPDPLTIMTLPRIEGH